MADPGYGDVFVVYLTADYGVRFLTNESWISMLDLLSRRRMTIAELSESIGMPRSTVQSGLVRMAEMGMVWSVRDPSDARKTVFRTRCVPLIRSIPPTDLMESLKVSAVRSMIERSGVPPYDLVILMVAELWSLGLDITPMLLETGIEVGMKHGADPGCTEPADIAECVRKLMGLENEISIDLSGEKGLTMTVTFGDQPPVPTSLVAGVVMALVQSRTDMVFSARVSTELSEDGQLVVVNSPPYVTGDEVGRLRPFISGPGGPSLEGPPFQIHLTGAGPVLVSNPGMMSAMDVIGYGEATAADVSEATGMSEATAHSVLRRLQSIGVVDCRRSDRVLIYSATSRCIQRFPSRGDGIERGMARSYRVDEADIRMEVYNHMMRVVDLLGLGSRELSHTIGVTVARSVLELYPRLTPQTFLEKMCHQHTCRGIDLALDSYLPVSISYLRGSESDDLALNMAEYVRAMVGEALAIITGHEYPVDVKIVDSREGPQ